MDGHAPNELDFQIPYEFKGFWVADVYFLYEYS